MDGIILVDKEQNFTSFDVVAIMRGITETKKVGHTGTLDPMATGILPILIGCCTRLSDLLPEDNKRYIAGFQLGITTDTQDIWGEVKDRRKFDVSRDSLAKTVEKFSGEQLQTPPMFSAVKQNGVKLYTLARSGIEVERRARRVFIEHIKILNFDPQTGMGSLDIRCSKGTYIRTIISDMGEILGCGAVMTALRRVEACGFSADNALTVGRLREIKSVGELGSVLLPPEDILASYPRADISQAQGVRFKNGAGLALDRVCTQGAGKYYRVYCEDRLLGLGAANDGELRVKWHAQTR